MAERVQIPVVEGRQIWQLVRTGADGASRAELPQMAAAATRYFLLTEPGESKGAKHELVRTGANEWRFGNVRPFKVLSIVRTGFPEPAPAGEVIADYQESLPTTIPSVRAPGGTEPWQITVEFWWRGAPKRIDYPAMSEGFFGRSYTLHGADWMLARAVVPPPDAADPGDQTWGDAQGDRVDEAAAEFSSDLAETVRKAALPAGALLLGGAALYLWLSRRR